MTTRTQLVACIFDGESKADDARRAIQALDERLDTITLGNIAVVRKAEQGQFSFTETDDVGAQRGGLIGVVAGGLVGTLGLPVVGPLSVAVGAAAGTLVGGLAARSIDLGFPDSALARLGEQLQAGSSALLTLVDPTEAEIVISELETLGGQLMQHTIPADVLAKLEAASKADPSEDDT